MTCLHIRRLQTKAQLSNPESNAEQFLKFVVAISKTIDSLRSAKEKTLLIRRIYYENKMNSTPNSTDGLQG